MYAVIETGGKQYRVEVGTELEIELIEPGPGESVAFDRVLLIADGDSASIGRPVVANAAVQAEVVRRERGEKLISFKYRPKARRRVKKGHRQELTVIRISDIVLDGKSAASDLAEAEEKRKTERQRLEEAARRQAAKDAELAAKLAKDQAEATTKAGEKPTKAGEKPAKAAAKRAGADAKAPTSDAAKARAARTGKAATADTTDSGAAKPSTTKASGATKRTRTAKTDKE